MHTYKTRQNSLLHLVYCRNHAKLVKEDYPTLGRFNHVFPHNYHSWNHYVGWIMALCFGLGFLWSLLNILFS